MADYRDELPFPLAAALWLVCVLFWGSAIFMGYRMRVVAMGVVMVILCAYLFLMEH